MNQRFTESSTLIMHQFQAGEVRELSAQARGFHYGDLKVVPPNRGVRLFTKY